MTQLSRIEQNEALIRESHPELSDYEVKELAIKLESTYLVEVIAEVFVETSNAMNNARKGLERLESAWLALSASSSALLALTEQPLDEKLN